MASESPLAKDHIQVVLPDNFKFGKQPSQVATSVTNLPMTVPEWTAQNWFKQVCEGDTNFKEQSHSEETSMVDDECLQQMFKANPHEISWDLAADPGYPTSLIKLDQRVTHQLSNFDCHRHAEIVASLLLYCHITTWLEYIITKEYKWCMYNQKHRL